MTPRGHDGGVKTGVVIERVERIAATRHDPSVDAVGLQGMLRDITAVEGWLTAAKSDAARRLAELVSFPEAAIADQTRDTLGRATDTLERSKTLDAAPDLASALDDGQITAGHVDAVTRAVGSLDAGQRDELIERCDQLTDVAVNASVEQWRKRVRELVRDIERRAGADRLERQKRATSLSSWVDQEGMWNLRGTFDPLTGVSLAAKLDQMVNTLFAENVPDTAPSDPVERNKHLRALALAALLHGTAPAGKTGRPEFVVVVDTTGDPARIAHGGLDTHSADITGSLDRLGVDWEVTWPIPVEIPDRVLRQMLRDPDNDVHVVIVRNGVVLHAPGELDLGRTTRLANRAQRRALRALYSTCAVPGCCVSYDRCKLHHIIWWRHLGTTDLENLIPLCTKHHGKVHHDDWKLTLGPNRELRLQLPDGTIMTTGPPNRRAA